MCRVPLQMHHSGVCWYIEASLSQRERDAMAMSSQGECATRTFGVRFFALRSMRIIFSSSAGPGLGKGPKPPTHAAPSHSLLVAMATSISVLAFRSMPKASAARTYRQGDKQRISPERGVPG